MLKHITAKFLIFTAAFLAFIAFKPTTVAAQQAPAYPKVTGFFGIVHPIGAFYSGSFHSGLSGVRTIGFPFGVNILKKRNLRCKL